MRLTIIKAGLGLLLAGGLGWGCQSGDLDVGQSVIAPSELNIQLVDTVSVYTSTVSVAVDSAATSADTTLLVGHWTDAQTGTINASSFATPTYTSNSLADLTDVVFDSLTLEMPYTYTYGDTNQLVTLRTYRLQTALEASRTYYNTSSVRYQSTPFAQKTFYPRFRTRGTRSDGLVRIRLDDALGQQLLAQIRSRTIIDNATFNTFLTGLAFTSESANNLYLSFSAARSGLVMYYHQTTLNSTESSIKFSTSGARFNRAVSDFSGSPLQSLKRRSDVVPSGATQNTTFVTQGPLNISGLLNTGYPSGPALYTRLEIPGLQQLALDQTYAGVNRAELIVQPIRTTLNDNMPPPPTLALYETNAYNEVLAAVPATVGSTATATATYAYNPYVLYLQDAYTFDLTEEVRQIMHHERTNRPLLLMAAGGNSGTTVLNRLTIGDRIHPTDRIQLRLYLTYTK